MYRMAGYAIEVNEEFAQLPICKSRQLAQDLINQHGIQQGKIVQLFKFVPQIYVEPKEENAKNDI